MTVTGDGRTYRPVEEEDAPAFLDALGYAFRPTEGPRREPIDDPYPGLGERRGVFAGNELLCACRHYFWTTSVRGATVDLAGLAGVATPPEHRRRGNVATLLSESLTEYRDRGYEFAALWPFERPFYARYGWGTCNALATVECPPGALAFADEYRDCEFRSLDPDEWEAIAPVYEAHSADQSLALDRDGEWWRERVFGSYVDDPYVYACERDGDPVGYVVYRVDEGDDGPRFVAPELAWTDRDAFRELLRFVYDHDSQAESVELTGRAGGPLRDLLDVVDPDDISYEVVTGPMVRVVDPVAALAALDYPDRDERVVLDVSDPVFAAEDPVVLAVSSGSPSVERDPDADPGVHCSVAALSQVVVGYRSVESLRHTADLDGDPDALERLGNLFPPGTVYLRDFF